MIDPSGRIYIRQDFSGLTIEVPAPRHWTSIVFVIIWLATFGVMGEVLVIKTFLDSRQAHISLRIFLGIWLTGWTIGCLGSLYQIIWELVGLEIITIEHQTLTIARNTPVWTRSKSYEIPHIQNFRLVEAEENTIRVTRSGRRKSTTDKGRIQFDYQQKTIKFGQSLTAKEAHRILMELKTSPKLDSEQFAD